MEIKPKHTPASIAKAHFASELELQDRDETARPVDTVVVLHDSCYGHRYSRPRTSRASLSTIVERPERIQASILGLSLAYVRLGERHAEGRFPLHPHKDASAIPTIPFRIRKTTRRMPLSAQAVTNVHGTKWMEELKIMCDNAEARLAMNGKELTRPDIHRGAGQETPATLHEGDLYLCAESLEAMEGALGAVCEGVDAVFNGSASGKGPHRTFVAIRPPGHHCSASHPSGFCWLNNVHVGISHAALTHGLTHAAIIDFDLHHGDGSQAITWEHNRRAMSSPKNALPWKKTSIGYFSLHDINSYPCEMGDDEKVKNASLCIENAHGQNIWNVHLHAWKSEKEFWELYENKYSILLEKTREYLRKQTERLRASPNLPKPKAAIFLSAGFDASEWEGSGMQRHKVNVPTEFYARLTRDVVALAAEEGTAVDGRVISVLEGGYSDRALCSGILSHISGLAGGKTIAINAEPDHAGLGYEMGQKIGAFNGSEKNTVQPVSAGIQMYDPWWWCLPNLEQLDALVNPPPVVEPKKLRDVTPPTYSSPTTSFMAKVQSPRVQRSVSNLSNGSPISTRPPSPPPPDVPWTVAAHELSKLLIPSDRQVASCKPEDLSAEATRVRRGRQSEIAPLPSNPGPESIESNTRMALRVRKPPKPTVDSVAEDDKPAAKANRRKTLAATAAVPTGQARPPSRSTTPKPEPGYTQPTNSSRRLSVASNTSDTSDAPPARAGHLRTASSGTTIMPPRTDSALSTRPDSSMSSRGPSIPPVVVKKTRAPPQPRSEVPKTSRVRKKSPLNDTGSASNVSDAKIVVRSSSGDILPPIRKPSTEQTKATEAPVADFDSLTSGMKKVSIKKITLTTKAQREAKEQEKASAKTLPSAKSPPRSTAAGVASAKLSEVTTTSNGPENVAAKEVQPAVPMQEGPPSVPDHSSMAAPPTHHAVPSPSTLPPQIQQSENSPTTEPTQIALPPSSPRPTTTPSTHAHPTAPLQNQNIFIPFAPSTPAPAHPHPHPHPQFPSHQNQEPLTWLPPNVTETPVAMRDSKDGKDGKEGRQLPVWSSTGVIPFGGTGGKVVKKEGKEEGLRGVKREGDGKEGQKGGGSIWDVPVTPRPEKR